MTHQSSFSSRALLRRATGAFRFRSGTAMLCAGVSLFLPSGTISAGPESVAPSPPRYQIDTIAGETLLASEVNSTDQRLEATIDGRRRSVPLSEIAAIHQNGQPARGDRPDPGAQHSDHVVTMVDGTTLIGAAIQPSNTAPGTFAFHPAWSDALTIPYTAVAGIRFRRADAADYEDRLKRREPGRDVLLLARDGKVLAVPGAVESISAVQCDFVVGRKLQTAPIHSLVGIVFGSQVPRKKPPARIALLSGDVIGATLIAIRDNRVQVNSDLIGHLDIPLPAVQRIELSSARVVSLVDLTPATTQVRSVLDTTWSVGRNANLRGQPLAIRGQVFPRGICVHAYSLLTYDLSTPYESFTTTVGIDDSAPEFASVVFRVKLDGRIVYESPVLRRTDAPVSVSVKLTGARLLEIECDPTDDLDIGDHAVWGSPILIKPQSTANHTDD